MNQIGGGGESKEEWSEYYQITLYTCVKFSKNLKNIELHKKLEIFLVFYSILLLLKYFISSFDFSYLCNTYIYIDHI